MAVFLFDDDSGGLLLALVVVLVVAILVFVDGERALVMEGSCGSRIVSGKYVGPVLLRGGDMERVMEGGEGANRPAGVKVGKNVPSVCSDRLPSRGGATPW